MKESDDYELLISFGHFLILEKYLNIDYVFKQKRFGRHVLSKFEHFQLMELLLVLLLYSEDILETLKN